MLTRLDEININIELIEIKLGWSHFSVVLWLWIVYHLRTFFAILRILGQCSSPSRFNYRMEEIPPVFVLQHIVLLLEASTKLVYEHHSAWLPVSKRTADHGVASAGANLLLALELTESLILAGNQFIERVFKTGLFNLVFDALILDVVKDEGILPFVAHVALV